MRLFLEGICELNDVRLIYRTFSTRTELTTLLGGDAFDDAKGRILVYIAAHGKGGRLLLGRNDRESVNLATVAHWLRPGVEGVWLGCCDVGGSRSLREFLKNRGAVWAGGYDCAVDWAPAMLVDVAVLQELTLTGPIRTRHAALKAFVRGLKGFDPAWVVGSDSKDRRVRLGISVKLLARDKIQGARVEDLSPTLRGRLKWSLST
jgi:hypothetical protein